MADGGVLVAERAQPNRQIAAIRRQIGQTLPLAGFHLLAQAIDNGHGDLRTIDKERQRLLRQLVGDRHQLVDVERASERVEPSERRVTAALKLFMFVSVRRSGEVLCGANDERGDRPALLPEGAQYDRRAVDVRIAQRLQNDRFAERIRPDRLGRAARARQRVRESIGHGRGALGRAPVELCRRGFDPIEQRTAGQTLAQRDVSRHVPEQVGIEPASLRRARAGARSRARPPCGRSSFVAGRAPAAARSRPPAVRPSSGTVGRRPS